MKLLVVEDNTEILRNIVDYLSLHGYDADPVQNGLGALHLAATENYDMVLLDLGIPGVDGVELCRQLRQHNSRRIPIIMLTARDSLEDKCLGFEVGADDYIVKPFALRELVCRIEAVMARYRPSNSGLLQVDTLILDTRQMRVSREGKVINLNKKCLQLLQVLMENSPYIVSKEQLESVLWGRDLPDSNSLKSHVYMLRSLVDKNFNYPLIHTVHGLGYKLSHEAD